MPAIAASIALIDGLVYVTGLTFLGVPSIASMGWELRELNQNNREPSQDIEERLPPKDVDANP